MKGEYTREEGKKISKLVDEIKVKLMELGRVIDANDITEVSILFRVALLQYAMDARCEVGRKMLDTVTGDFKKSLMEIEKDENQIEKDWEDFLR